MSAARSVTNGAASLALTSTCENGSASVIVGLPCRPKTVIRRAIPRSPGSFYALVFNHLGASLIGLIVAATPREPPGGPVTRAKLVREQDLPNPWRYDRTHAVSAFAKQEGDHMTASVHPLPSGPRRRPTATSNFGVGRREGHDAGAFYARFTPPELSDDAEIRRPRAMDRIWCHDAADMDRYVDDKSVALVVTSPPYFAGKAYEEALGEGHIPADYDAYLRMLTACSSSAARKLEPGGRIAVNVANLGRKPYRSLSADVIDILEHLGLAAPRRDHLAEEPRRRAARAPGAPTSARATRCCAT